mgnify:CR=1 FL=1
MMSAGFAEFHRYFATECDREALIVDVRFNRGGKLYVPWGYAAGLQCDPVEKKPLPYLLSTMNLLLHGIETPNIRRDNALKNPLNEIGEKDRFDVIVTNPPFGGEEEAGVQANFPEGTRTSETAGCAGTCLRSASATSIAFIRASPWMRRARRWR